MPSPELLSGLLRVAFTNDGASFDLNAERAKRAGQMRSIRQRVTSSAGSDGGPQAWRELARGIPSDTPGYSAHAAQYRKFLAGIALALGGEASSAEVGEASKIAFRAIQAGRAVHKNTNKDEADVSAPRGLGEKQKKAEAAVQAVDRAALKLGRTWLGAPSGTSLPAALMTHSNAAARVFGSPGPSDEALRQMLAAHEPLEAWLREHRPSAGASRNSGGSNAEYGASYDVLPDTGWSGSLAETAERYSTAAVEAEEAERAEATGDGEALDGWLPTEPTAEADAAGHPEVRHDVSWLRQRCRLHLEAVHFDSGGASQIEVDMLAASILTELESGKSDDHLQGDLLELLGYSAFDFIAELLPQRAVLATAVRKLLAAARGGAAGAAPLGPGAQQQQQQIPGCAVSLTSLSAKASAKARRKEQQKQAREMKRAAHEEVRSAEELDEEVRWLAEAGFEPATQYISELAAAAAPAPVSETLAMLREGAGIGGVGKSLPEGTQRFNRNGYEEVRVPPASKGSVSEQRLVQISELPEYAQMAFKGVKALNRLQSAVVGTALYSNENMLVCAPTGAGKTNVALLSVMQQVGSCVENGVLDRDKLKMVYIAPMKALAQELVGKFSKSLAPLGLQVREYTGDMQLTKREILMTQLIVTTPEKWDVVTRKGSDALVQSVGLLIIDEVHLLNDDRGPVIEALVARTLRLVESSQQMIRIVGLSATLPNHADVALFLKVNPQTGLYYFGDAYRPVPLSQTFIGVQEKNVLKQKAAMLDIAYDKALAALRNGKQVSLVCRLCLACSRWAASITGVH